MLTWEAMPPEHVEDAREFGGNRVERLANGFAAAMLMPRATVDAFGGWERLDEAALIERLNTAADELRVTSSALRWRLVALRHLPTARARALPEAALRNNGRERGGGFAAAALFAAVRGRCGGSDRPGPCFRPAGGRTAGT